MRRRKYIIEDNDKEDRESWLTTYSDMITLILTFFVLLISLSVFQSEHLTEALDSLREAFGVKLQSDKLVESEPISQSQEELDKLVKAAKEIEQLKGVTVTLTMKGIKLELENPVLFDTGEAELRSEAKGILKEISNILQKYSIKNEINISGHTDNRPIHTLRFPSNWELSTARATNVLRYSIQTGLSPKRMSASGYGQYRPIASNETAEGRAKNRRMEILILKKYRTENQEIDSKQESKSIDD